MKARFGDRRGYVFCARVADAARPQFRFVESPPPTDGTSQPQPWMPVDPLLMEAPTIPAATPLHRLARVDDNTLSCLDRARPSDSFDTPRTLEDNTYQGAFAAWEAARADIVEKWNFLSDKANLEPKVPRALRRAAEVVRTHPPSGVTQEKIDRAVDTLHAPYSERTIRTFRAALATSDDPARQARRILEAIDSLGLQPYIAPQPLDEITPEDVHLVCWVALT